MADDSSVESELPPKLDLRKKGIVPLVGTEPSGAVPVGQPPVAASKVFSPSPVSVTSVKQAAIPAAPAIPVAPTSPLASTAPAASVKPIASATPYAPTTPVVLTPPALVSGVARGVSQDAAKPVTEGGIPGRPTLMKVPVPAASTPLVLTPVADTPAPRPVIRPVLASRTIKLKKPVPIGVKRESADLSADIDTKRSTSKISLPADIEISPTAVPSGTKTIRIAPMQVEAAKLAGGQDIVDGARLPPAMAPIPDPKRQTSRISLESVLGNDSSSSAPKTIKLQRPPSSSGTIKVQAPDASGPGAVRKETSSVNLPAEEMETEKPDAEKKTIKVKRPSAKPFVRSATASGQPGTDDSQPALFTPPTALVVPKDSPHGWIFVLSACAASLVACVLIYVQMAQVFGPDVCMTEYSYGAPGLELAWPGRISR